MSMTVLRLDVSDLSEVKELIKKVFMRFEAQSILMKMWHIL